MSSAAPTHWVSQLAARYEAAVDLPAADPALTESLTSLRVADASLSRQAMVDRWPQHTRHTVVLGPTQSGKSTLVNHLLDATAAAVSALAGFTVHSQGYGPSVTQQDIDYVDGVLAPLQRIAGAALESREFDRYVLETVATGPKLLCHEDIVWDTPDFDSISASNYTLALLKTLALADRCILMVSKDKYGDKRVWDILTLVQALGKPLVVCINKIDQADEEVVQNAFTRRFDKEFNQAAPPLVMLPFIKPTSPKVPTHLPSASLERLQGALQRTVEQSDKPQDESQAERSLRTHCARFIDRHAAQWLSPLLSELDAKARWDSMLVHAIDKADTHYTHHYLNNPDNYQTFNKTLAELLTLLEIPGIAPTLAQARRVVTWPARRLLGWGRDAIGKSPEPVLSRDGTLIDQEGLVLEQMFDDMLVSLQRQLLEAANEPWWRALDRQLRDELPGLRKRYSHACQRARTQFEPQIEQAAQKLYGQLKKQPRVLNSLRAARVTADAAGIALAVKSGGLAPADLVLAPAMFSVTTLLTESALGRYLDTVKRELKNRQSSHMRSQLLEAMVLDELSRLAQAVDSSQLAGTQLEPALQAKVATLQAAS